MKRRAQARPSAPTFPRILLFALGVGLSPGLWAAPAVVLNEIHYHPVEMSAFDAAGAPLLDLSEDVHEFVELYNAGATNVSLAGWRLSGDITFAFPTNALIEAGRHLVVARDPVRLRAIPQYNSLTGSNLFGPYQGNLPNGNGTVRLRDTLDGTVDSVSYSSEFPWAIGADALGADDEWTGLISSNFQYRGRSLERVSAAWTPNDPANWVASPAPGNPSPGRANAVTRGVPKPVVTAISAYQDSTRLATIRANQAVRIDCAFSGTTSLSAVQVEYFLDDINVTNETRSTVTMTATGVPGDATYTAILPGRLDRSVVRYRIRANRGTGLEAVSPRADDPFLWHAYFVSPVRNSTNRSYDCFLSTASLNTLATNLNPAIPAGVDTAVQRRIQLPDPPGIPSTTWNATQPAILVANGVVYDARARYHGSQYRRTAANNSWKWQFPRYQKLDGRGGIFISDNDDITVACGLLYRLAGVPQSYTRWIDFYLNTTGVVRRMDQDEMDDELLKQFFAEQRLASPEMPKEESGEFYKAQGNFLFTDPTGPFGYGGYRLLPALPPYWTEVQRYENTYGLQMNGWKGHQPFQSMLHGLWAARGDTHTAPNPNLANLRTWLSANFDVDTTLTSMAIRAWAGGWDNFNHNHFTWRRANGKWTVLQWDFDGELDIATTNVTIYPSEQGAPLIYGGFAGPPAWVDANWINDSFFKAFREDYKRKLWVLNNTVLNPTNITAVGLGSFRAFADGRFASVNRQVALGTFARPRTPTHLAPASLEAVVEPTLLVSSAYSHPTSPTPAHRSTTWWIRATNSTYDAPLFKTTSTSNLTSLPIPFERLTFGQAYYWKCAHTDTNDHSSFESAETQFIYGAEPSFASVIRLDENTPWRFNTNGAVLPTNWRVPGYDDSLWSVGVPLIGDDAPPLPEPIRTPIQRASRLVTYFRKSFVFSGNPVDAFVRLRHIVDDGVVVWLNGVEIHRLGVAGTPGSFIGNTTPANRAVTDAVYEGPFYASPTNLVVGQNVIAATVHRSSTVSPDLVFGLSLDIAVPPRPGNVVINEIVADNRGAVTNGTTSPDYVELYNNTDTAQNLDGLSLSDNLRRPGKFIFPPGTTLAPRSHLVVWCDSQTNAPGLHAGFALDNDGQTVALFTLRGNGFVLADSVTYGLQIPNHSITRRPDGVGPWVLALPSPAAAAVGAVPTDSPSVLKINEWMASDANGPDWVELYNPSSLPVELSGLGVTDNPSQPAKSLLAPLSFIAPEGFRQLIADEDPGASARHVDFKLSSGGEQIALYDTGRNLIDLVVFGPQLAGVSEGRLPDGSASIVAFPTTASPDEANYLPVDNVRINEVLAHSDLPLEDAVELFNPTDVAAEIGHWWLSDDRSRPRKFQLPPGTTVPARGYVVVYENQFNPGPGNPSAFAFSSAHGDEVHLSAASSDGTLTGYRTSVKFAPSASGVSLGRFETSVGPAFVALSRPTFGTDNPGTVEQFRTGTGAPNASAAVGPIVISEVHYHPADLLDGSDNTRDEFIELRNLTPNPVPLFHPDAPANTWRLRDAVDFIFPGGITLAPNEAVLVVSFNPVSDTNALASFRETHGPVSARLFGPWSGKLDNSRDSVELIRPDAPVTEPGPDLGYVPSLLADRVEYLDRFPWPEAADGIGFSLMRDPVSGFGDEPLNWLAWYPTPGRANVLNQPPAIAFASPADGASILGPADILLTANASDPDGSVIQVDFYDGTNRLVRLTQAPFEYLWSGATFGPHTLTAIARDNGYATAVSTPISVLVASQPPVVRLLTPTNGAVFAAGTTLNLNATATDVDTAIARVEFSVDGVKIGEDSVAPYTATWTTTTGYHVVRAEAIDAGGTPGSATSSIFGQTVSNTEAVALAQGSIWRYFDAGTYPGATWTTLAFNDGAWASGAAELGFGDGDETTIIRQTVQGVTSLAFYFRQKFVLSSAADVSAVQLNLLRDDGAVVYLNGVEVARDNMPAGVVNNTTLATVAIGNADEFTFFPFSIPPARLVAGLNVLAVEVHQAGATSSDVSFNAELRVSRASYGPALTTTPASQRVAPGSDVTFTVAATGTAPFTYQWTFNQAPLPGETGPTLQLTGVQPAQSGAYAVTVANAIATVTSPTATLTVSEDGGDTDGDGLPDEWELRFGLNRFSAADRDLDPDGDRMSNWAEFVAGTDPTSALSLLKIDAITRGPASTLTFTAAASTPYEVQFKNQLGAGPWQTLSAVPARATNHAAVVVDPSLVHSRFFRLATPATPPVPARILSLTPGAATMLTFGAVSNRNYVVQYHDGTLPVVWKWLSDVPARATNHTAVVGDPAGAPNRYYRLVIP